MLLRPVKATRNRPERGTGLVGTTLLADSPVRVFPGAPSKPWQPSKYATRPPPSGCRGGGASLVRSRYCRPTKAYVTCASSLSGAFRREQTGPAEPPRQDRHPVRTWQGKRRRGGWAAAGEMGGGRSLSGRRRHKVQLERLGCVVAQPKRDTEDYAFVVRALITSTKSV